MKKQVKREEIIETAKKLIMQKGYRKTSVEDITNEVGIAKGSFYTYFKSKDFLIETLLSEKGVAHKEIMSNLIKRSNTLDEAVKKYVEYYLVLPTKDIEFVLVMVKMMRSIDSVGKGVIGKIEEDKKNRKNEFTEIMKKFIDEIDIKSEKDFERYGFLVFGMINTFYINNFLPAENRLSEAKYEEVKEKMLNIDFKYEIDFMTRAILKLIKK